MMTISESLKRALIWLAVLLVLGLGIWGYLRLRKQRGRAYFKLIDVDKSSGIISLAVNGELKRFIVEPGVPKTFSPSGYVQVIPTDVDAETKRVTRAKIYVFDAKDTPIPSETLDIPIV